MDNQVPIKRAGRPKLPDGEAQRRINERRRVLKESGYWSNYYEEKGIAIRERSKVTYARKRPIN